MKATGRAPVLGAEAQPEVEFEPARALGAVWALQELWKTLGFGELRRVFRGTRYPIDVEALVRVMVFNRLCDPESKLGVLRWLETVALPDRPADITHQHLLRSMDALMEHRDAVDRVVARLLRPLIDQDLSVVFYDLTTIRAEGDSMQEGDVRRFGMAKEGVIARQFLLGVVQTAEGVPIYHEVFDGNVAETRTLLPTLGTVLERFPSVRRQLLVADRGLLSLDNLEALRDIRLANGRALEFIVAVPGRRCNEFLKELRAFHKTQCQDAQAEVITEQIWHDLRLVVAHDPETAAEQTGRRNARINALLDQADAWADKLDAQDLGENRRGRPLSDRGATARLYHAVAEAHLSRIIKVDLKSPVLRYHIDGKARALAELMDGKLLLVTHATDLTAPEVGQRYNALADIERGFRVLKSEIEVGSAYHRLPERIRAHAQICFMALILHRVMCARLHAAHTGLSPERALEQLTRIQHQCIRIAQGDPVTGVSAINADQAGVFSALGVKKPAASQQLSLL